MGLPESLGSISASSVWKKNGSLLLHCYVILQSQRMFASFPHAQQIQQARTDKLMSFTCTSSELHLPNNFTSTVGGSAGIVSNSSAILKDIIRPVTHHPGPVVLKNTHLHLTIHSVSRAKKRNSHAVVQYLCACSIFG